MPKAYSDDLRCKLLEAYEAGRGTLREVAEQFRVSWGYSKKIRRQQLRTGKKERVVQAQHGPVSCVTATVQEQLQAVVRQQPDVTLAELQQRIKDSSGVGLSKSSVWRWLRRLGLRHKKNAARTRTRERGEFMAARRLVGSSQRR